MTSDSHPLDTNQTIRKLALELEDALRRQEEVLMLRSISLAPGLLDAVSAVHEDIGHIETHLVDAMTTLSQLRTLTGTSEQINSSLDLDVVLAEAMDRVITLTGAERGYIVLTDANPFEAGWDVRIARDPEQNGTATPVFQGSRTILKEVLESGTTLLTDNAYNDPVLGSSATIASMVLRSVLCVPLKLKDQVIGAVYVDNRMRAGLFTPQALTLLTAFANQASVAIGNARLYSHVQASIDTITELKELMDHIFASIGSGVITTNQASEVVICNAASEQILSRPAEHMVGRPLAELLPDGEVILAEALQAVLTGEAHPVIDAEWSGSNQERRSVNIKLSPLKDAEQVTQGAALVLHDLTQQRDDEEMLRVIRRYLPPAMVDNIQTIAALALGGERRETTCMFVDVRPLSTFPPDLRPQQIMEMLNLYLSAASGCIHDAGGVIDKYMGNEIMGLFNSQLNPLEDHAARALEAALNIRDRFVRLYAELGLNPDPHYYRIGIHTGVATLGNVGSEIRRDFTAIGDTINLSKRLEENARAGQIILSDDTRHAIDRAPGGLFLEAIRLAEHQAIQVKGRQQRTRIYEVFRA
ncbi:MAG: GAF domain-containing protein [Anaerolineae bacterium]|nr:GAF domain-containing protein [Anaerolineae bacterium]